MPDIEVGPEAARSIGTTRRLEPGEMCGAVRDERNMRNMRSGRDLVSIGPIRADRCTRVCGVLLAVLVLSATGGATAMTIPDDPVLSDPSVLRLDRGDDDRGYELVFTGASVDPGWTNRIGDTVSISAEIRFGAAIVDEAIETMLVFTSIRLGSASVSCASLSPGGGLAFASFSVAPGSFGGAVDRVTAATDSQAAGASQVCNAEDSVAPFVSAVFDGTSDVYAFTFKIQQTKDGVDLAEFQQLRFMAQAYVAPEPGTGLLVMLGLTGLGAVRRRGGRG